VVKPRGRCTVGTVGTATGGCIGVQDVQFILGLIEIKSHESVEVYEING
jgi:hypothetical protein